jgi:hypothetical protein
MLAVLLVRNQLLLQLDVGFQSEVAFRDTFDAEYRGRRGQRWGFLLLLIGRLVEDGGGGARPRRWGGFGAEKG